MITRIIDKCNNKFEVNEITFVKKYFKTNKKLKKSHELF